jgi:hypothetical protein
MPAIADITEGPILITNGEGADDDEEWHLPDFGQDADYWDAFAVYRRWRDEMGYAYDGGWAQQLATHIEIIELFQALDALIERPDHGHS